MSFQCLWSPESPSKGGHRRPGSLLWAALAAPATKGSAIGDIHVAETGAPVLGGSGGDAAVMP